ncbi:MULTISPECIES: ABC transporter permease [Microbacterium]|uniref:ABC transporter permease n=1 Tax=Microbacterium wangchenii TaxID=2541726 RepID=A0ABX5SSC1_9MICO|nr:MULTISPECIES: ABC transporter permease [Microbacterium]MCK6066723.1 ABC transporter permease [Microbacterium sp. EYE_512]QBR88048.1 ABC transporter permease [Microbacterium wangchenii]TFV83835.1 ABC transporter permease [Microbacterium sp. dk485]TXK18162.1 ABC transporter permease [Microbacterium wangchenii]
MSQAQTDPAATEQPPRTRPSLGDVLHDIASGGIVRTAAAIVLSLVVASVLIVVTNQDVGRTLPYFFSRPTDFLQAAGQAIGDAYAALFRGSIYNYTASSAESAIRPLLESLRFAGPLIAAGLGVALTFRAGLFNIGGQGQMVIAAIWAAWASFQLHLPYGLHLVVAILFGLVGAAIWAGIAGFLKAATGAHEVIVTIMMNYIAVSLATFLMRTPVLHDMDSGNNPTTRPPDPTAVFPRIFAEFDLRWSFVLCIVAVGVFWWLMERSSLGFRLRMVGLNPDAARTAGVDVKRMYIVAMVLSGMFIGVAGLNQALGRDGNFGPTIDAGIGFDAITVALLGGSRAGGVLLAGLLFGMLRAAGPTMQLADVAPEILGVIQGLIVLFIAAPPLVRAIFRFLPVPREVTELNTGRKPQLEAKEAGQ